MLGDKDFWLEIRFLQEKNARYEEEFWEKESLRDLAILRSIVMDFFHDFGKVSMNLVVNLIFDRFSELLEYICYNI